MSREVEVLIEFGCDILLVIVFMGLIYMIAQWSCKSELNTQLDDELENKSIIELRRQRQNLANRSGGNIDLPSPAFSRASVEHWQEDIAVKMRGTPKSKRDTLAGNVVDF